jgi:hypothetical protein
MTRTSERTTVTGYSGTGQTSLSVSASPERRWRERRGDWRAAVRIRHP